MATPNRPSGFGGQGVSPRPSKRPGGAARREVNLAAKSRRKAERAEYRRFTASTRQRRLSLTAGIGSVVVLAIVVVVATTSPLFALTSIRVEGVGRLPVDEVIAQLQPLAGTPLARVSPDDVVGELSDVALVQSVSSAIELPNTLVVRITERTPIVASQVASGYAVLDRAGVVLWEQESRPPEFPLLVGAADPSARGFQEVAAALAAIPGEVLSRIDRVSASSADTVLFTLRNSSHRVLWGSSDMSGEKARALPAALNAAGLAGGKLIDLSSPDTVVIRSN